MAKTYSIVNTSYQPARPVILMTGRASGSVGRNYKMLNTDGMPEILTEAEYALCADAIERYEKAGIVKLTVLDAEAKEKAKLTGNETLDELREMAQEAGVKGWHIMKESSLREALTK